ncbi:pentatricopeptide repeat-containing protein At3g02650, mitochondrial [Impatiens glandulifera]|uniref:pentatricopeptide repeat-containing protein At3g02650, mitochondrial n=1 Tax=Impatiens glandulifera TaxID=253017 RepID=UPI001FB06E04|nr:pentatricopeptide repeat-containing protein At3g02650, mitochondrial [Impatiens glandulifera]
MWRSIVSRTECFRHSGRTKLQRRIPSTPYHDQVHQFQTASFIQTSSHLSHIPYYPKLPNLSINPRFYSPASFDQSNLDIEPHLDSPVSETGEVDDVLEQDTASFTPKPDIKSIDLETTSYNAELMEKMTFLVQEDQIREIDAVKFETLLSLLQSSENADCSLEESLNNMELDLHEEFILKVLETPCIEGGKLIRFFRWSLSKQDVCSIPLMMETLCCYLKKNDAHSLWDLVREIGEKEKGNAVNTNILNGVISLFSKLGKGKAALDVLNSFENLGCVPNEDTYYYTIEAQLGKRSFHSCASSIIQKMLNSGKLPDENKTGKIISYLCKGNLANDAYLVYLSAKEKKVHLPKPSIHLLISSLSLKDDTVPLALEILNDLPVDDRRRAINTFSSVVRGLCRSNDINGAKELVSRMIEAGPPPGNAVFNYIIESLSKAGELEDALNMVKLMETRGLKPDVYAYGVIISGYVKGGEMGEARKVLAAAKSKHSKISRVVYHSLIRGYCKLEEFDKAVQLLNEMKASKVQPNGDEYSKLIKSLCLKGLDWRTSEKLLDEMERKSIHFNGMTKGLVTAVKEMMQEEEEVGITEVAVQAA